MTDTELKELNQELDELKSLLLQKGAEKGTKTLLEEVNNKFIAKLNALSDSWKDSNKIMKDIAKESKIDKKEILEAVKNIKLEPKIEIAPSKINIPPIVIPKIEMPKFRIPTPQVTVNAPDVIIPETKFPKEMTVTGFASFVKAMTSILKNRATSIFGEVDRENPLPVILTDKNGDFYKAMMSVAGGGGFRIVNIGNEPTVNVKKGTNSVISTVTMTSANTSYPLTLPLGTIIVDIKLRAIGAVLKYSWTDFGNYMSISAGGARRIDGIRLGAEKILYFQSTSAAQTAECEIVTE